MMIQTTLPRKTEFYIFLSVVELAPEKARLYYGTTFREAPAMHDAGVRSFLITRGAKHFNIPREQAAALYDTYTRATYCEQIERPIADKAKKGELEKRTCSKCGSATTYTNRDGYALWYRTPDGSAFHCMKCYSAQKHKPRDKSAKACKKCKSTKTYVYNGYPRWHTSPDGQGLLCHKCYSMNHYENSQKSK